MPDDEQQTPKPNDQPNPPADDDDEDDLPPVTGGDEGYKELVKKLRGEIKSLRRESNTLKAKEAERDAAAKAEQDTALAEQGKWQQLAESREKRIGELEPLTDQVKRLSTALNAYLERERDGLPEAVLAAIDRMDAVDQLEYIAKYGETLRQAPKPGGYETGAGQGRGGGAPTKAQLAEQAYQDAKQSGRYGRVF